MTTRHISNLHRRGVLGGLLSALAGLGTLLGRPRRGLGAPNPVNTAPAQGSQQGSRMSKQRSSKPPIWIGHI